MKASPRLPPPPGPPGVVCHILRPRPVRPHAARRPRPPARAGVFARALPRPSLLLGPGAACPPSSRSPAASGDPLPPLSFGRAAQGTRPRPRRGRPLRPSPPLISNCPPFRPPGTQRAPAGAHAGGQPGRGAGQQLPGCAPRPLPPPPRAAARARRRPVGRREAQSSSAAAAAAACAGPFNPLAPAASRTGRLAGMAEQAGIPASATPLGDIQKGVSSFADLLAGKVRFRAWDE
jgi:hypothetical protein